MFVINLAILLSSSTSKKRETRIFEKTRAFIRNRLFGIPIEYNSFKFSSRFVFFFIFFREFKYYKFTGIIFCHSIYLHDCVIEKFRNLFSKFDPIFLK